MVSFPNGKINLGLNIISKREDGYHDIETVFYPVGLKDVLEIIPSADLIFTFSGLMISGKMEDNLCLKAYNLLKKDFPTLPIIKIHLHKAIPMGAGFGGGSADGAFMLKMLNDKFHLGLSNKQLSEYALQLGSDCHFFIINKPSLATERGQAMIAVNPDLSEYKFVLIDTGIHISTKWAFSQITPSRPSLSIAEIIARPVETWKEYLKNDFEDVVFKIYPETEIIKKTLYNNGATYASMSGSGSGVFGIFNTNFTSALKFEQNYKSTWVT